jgi:hypothetical protein
LLLEFVKNISRKAIRIVRCLAQIGRNPGDEHKFADVLRSILARITRRLPAAHRMADERKVMQIKCSDELMKIFGKSVVVIARPGLARLTESPAVIRNHPIASINKHRHLFFPRATAQRIPVDQYNWFTRTIVFVMQFDICGVFLTNCDVRHRDSPLVKLFSITRQFRRSPSCPGLSNWNQADSGTFFLNESVIRSALQISVADRVVARWLEWL